MMNNMSMEAKLLKSICDRSRPIRIMHICGTHERTISRYGLRNVLPKEIEILSGPGCPVCVTPVEDIDIAIALARSGIIITSYGDMLRVPGSSMNLMEARSEGCDIRTVYSIDDAITIAKEHPSRDVVFFAIGFETTAPTNAATLLRKPPKNFSLLTSHRLIPPALLHLLDETNIDAFIAPGHVCAITGIQPYQQFADLGFPIVSAGFEANDVLLSILMLLEQSRLGRPIVENAYPSVVRRKGNLKAQEMMASVFDVADAQWRGLGTIKNSGLKLKNEFADHDAVLVHENVIRSYKKETSYERINVDKCRCADILKGKEEPDHCPLFGTDCTPVTPIGSCMVSQEGMCYNWYQYRNV
ncbi:hydrogenase formation protein HypD [Methanococcoides seepicolus]|nr:hydrogenase formation protein HypD [Methanococcoides seepicolus]